MKRIIAVAVLLSVAILSGCATVQKADPNRPIPPQPAVSTKIKAELAAKPLKSFPIVIGNFVYYDINRLIGQLGKSIHGERIDDFAKVFPKRIAKLVPSGKAEKVRMRTAVAPISAPYT